MERKNEGKDERNKRNTEGRDGRKKQRKEVENIGVTFLSPKCRQFVSLLLLFLWKDDRITYIHWISALLSLSDKFLLQPYLSFVIL